MLCEISSQDIERARSEGLVHGDVHAADPSPVHADVGNKIAASIDYHNVPGLSDFNCLLFGGCNNLTCLLQRDHHDPLHEGELASTGPQLLRSIAMTGK